MSVYKKQALDDQDCYLSFTKDVVRMPSGKVKPAKITM